MDKMKNLFSFATKELEQDAFLRWMFESWEHPDIYPIVHNLLEAFCNLNETDKIENIKTVAQWKNINIRVDIDIFQKAKVVLFIEDKTFSSEHSDQLSRYNKEIESLEGEKHKVFYKTHNIYGDESKRVQEAGWEKYDLQRILKLFSCFEDTNVFLIKQYIDHLKELVEINDNMNKPEGNETQNDLHLWDAYYQNTIIPRLEKIINENNCVADSWIWRNVYTLLYIQHNNKTGEKMPYLEIRSRDCLGNNFKALVLCYDIDEQVLQKMVPVLSSAADESGFWNTKYQRRRSGKEPKQICFYEEKLETDSAEEFAACVTKCIEQYIELLKHWSEAVSRQ